MIFRLLSKILYTILLIIETFVALRFVFKLVGANDSNWIVKFVYELSGIFVRPFVGILNGDWNLGRFYIDVDALIALLVYMIAAFVVVEIMKVFSTRQING